MDRCGLSRVDVVHDQVGAPDVTRIFGEDVLILVQELFNFPVKLLRNPGHTSLVQLCNMGPHTVFV